MIIDEPMSIDLIIDEPMSDTLINAGMKALWRCKHNIDEAAGVLSKQVATDPILQTEISGMIVRSIDRYLIMNHRPMK